MHKEQEHCRIPHPLECLYIASSTICNLNCIFCAYDISEIEKQTMPYKDFTKYIEKAVRFGFDTFNLTPLIGESLIDPTFFEKLIYLENRNDVAEYDFCTNLTRANDGFFNIIKKCEKLRSFSISIYGHDQQSFTEITRSDFRWYQNVINNLHKLTHCLEIHHKTELRIRSVNTFNLLNCHSELCQLIKQLEVLGVRVRIPCEYQNWGGLIPQDQLINNKLIPKKNIQIKKEPCVFLFFKHTIRPDGFINACSAGDGNGRFVIGNISQQAFEDIYSGQNSVYMNLIQSHLNRDFNNVCQSCSAYRPLSADWYSYKFHRKPFITMSEFFNWLGFSDAET